jgi:glyoxylase-like metal-dependent hydrolase (beta-lactamase superfamily II)
MKSLHGLLSVALVMLAALPARAQLAPGSMDVHWNAGAQDCGKNPPPPLQVHRYNGETYILRENPCATAEAPFMYLLLGSRRALLIDSGDVREPARAPLAQTVQGLLPGKGAARLPLLVLHTHGHLDHREGDEQLRALPNVEVVGTDLEHVRRFFAFADWPNEVAQIDLGGRIVDVLPTPGHYASEVSYYDRNTALFFSGDFFLPGRLLIADQAADLASAERVADFIRARPVSYVLGGHIELDAHGESVPLGSHYHPNEHVLQLSKADLMGLPAVVRRFNGFYTRDGMYVMLSQNRVLAVMGAAVLAVLLALVLLVRRLIKARRSGRILRRP